MHSATKWIGGHGIAIGGAIVDGGRFDWRASGKFGVLTEPYGGYHGIVFDEQFGTAAFIMRARTEGLRDFGACLSPTNAFQLLQGVETLGVRMDRHIQNTHLVLEALKSNKAVDWVLHPSLEDHPDYQLAKTLLPRGAGSIVSFGIKGGRPAGRKFIESLRMISHLANVGDAKTLVIHPASHHASADGCRAAQGRRHRRGAGAAVGRHRDRLRHHRRSRAGAAHLAEGLTR